MLWGTMKPGKRPIGGLKNALNKVGHPYDIYEGEGAFYGTQS